MERINIAELLKDCSSGMELDCIMLEGSVVFEDISEDDEYPIGITLKNGDYTNLTKYGQYLNLEEAKCVIYPKGKTTWEGFVPPRQFKDGDVLFVDCADKESDGDVYKYIFILKEIDSLGNYFSYCHLSIDVFFPSAQYLFDNRYIPRLATEEEKQKLFNAIKDNGFRWNAETKTIEKLPKFKVGDRIKRKDADVVHTIKEVGTVCYVFDDLRTIHINVQDNYKLVPNKFDINTLVPFESRVLVRNANNKVWRPNIFGCYMKDKYAPFYVLGGTSWKQCIPYEGNQHLLCKTTYCDEYFKTWK